jgi:nucleotide-binding universal stress UspA family protein
MVDSAGREGPILIAIDFSEDSKAALAWGCAEAVKWGTRVVVLHVVHDPLEAPGYYNRSPEDTIIPLRESAQRMQEKFLATAKGETGKPSIVGEADIEAMLVSGLPATRIIEIAQDINASHIVMGSRGQTGLRHLLLGSKAERVVQISPIPVTIIKAAES